jgi:hypothetical protein
MYFLQPKYLVYIHLYLVEYFLSPFRLMSAMYFLLTAWSAGVFAVFPVVTQSFLHPLQYLLLCSLKMLDLLWKLQVSTLIWWCTLWRALELARDVPCHCPVLWFLQWALSLGVSYMPPCFSHDLRCFASLQDCLWGPSLKFAIHFS